MRACSMRLRRPALVPLLALLAACAEPSPAPSGAADVPLTVVDVITDTETPVDAGADVADAKADAQLDATDAKDTAGIADTADAKADTKDADAAGLPLPATVPDDLPPGVTVVPLSATALDGAGFSPDVVLQLPAKTVSFLTVVRGAHPGFFQLAKAVSPLGIPIAKGKCGTEVCIDCTNRFGPSPATGAGLLPSSSGVSAKAGKWHLSSCGFQWGKQGSTFAPFPYAGPPVDTVAFVRTTADGQVPSTGRVQLRLVCTGGAGLSAATALGDPRVQGMLAETQAVFLPAGITVEVVDVRDAGPGHALIDLPEDLTTTGASDLDLLFAEAAAFGGSAVVDVFLVGQIIGGSEGKGIVGGVAGSIPGPAFYHGIPRAGVAIALGSLGKDTVLMGRTLAHELGHFLGLWHPTEAHGKAFDPLEDTPQCPASQDADGDGTVGVAECAGLGGDNVMFWFAGSVQALFSAEQGKILRGHPLVLSP